MKGYHVELAGCIACARPVPLQTGARLVTLKTPEKEAESLAKAVAVTRNTFGFDSLTEAFSPRLLRSRRYRRRESSRA